MTYYENEPRICAPLGGGNGPSRRAPAWAARVMPALVMAALAIGRNSAAAGVVEQPLGFTLGPGETISYDSNVLRLPAGQFAPKGRSDLYSTTDLSGSLHEVYGREDVDASATVGRVLYKNFTNLDFTQQDVRGSVHSHLPLNIDASLAASHSAQLARFADISTPTRNVISTNDVHGDLGVPVYIDLRAVVGGRGAWSRNSSDLFKTQDYNTAEVNGGIRYQPTTGNRVDLLARTVHGTYINGTGTGTSANLISPGYRDHAVDLSADWTFTGESHLHGRAGYVRRSNDDLLYQPANSTKLLDLNRNFSGPAFDVTYLWQATAATSLKLYALRETGAAGDNSYLSAVTHTVRITPAWLPTTKTEIDAYYQWSRRDYFTNVLVALGQSPGIQRLDLTHSVGLTASWTPRRWLQATVEVRHENRDSTDPTFPYVDNFASVQVQGNF